MFTGPKSVNNIFSRVTGGGPSVIDGLLQSSIAGANFYLLNPSGVLFGPHAQLDVSASFHVSTANEIRFQDGSMFSANLAVKSTLTVSPPVTFGFLHSNPVGITIEGSQLTVTPGATLSVTGGDITIQANQEGTMQNPSLVAPSGRIYLTSVASAGDVQIEALDSISRLTNNRPQRLGSIWMRDGTLILASGERGGTIMVEAGILMLVNGATMLNSTSGADQSGDIVITADALTLQEGAAIISSTDPGALGNAGHVRVGAQNVAIRDGALVASFTLGDGRGGDVTLVADALTMDGSGSQILTATQQGIGNAGNIRVEARTVSVTNGAQIGSGVGPGAGQGGNVTIIAQDSVILNGFGESLIENENILVPSVIGTQNQPGSTGGAGNVWVEAQTVSVTNGAQIQSGVFGAGQGGDLTVIAQDSVILDGFGGGLLSLISANSQPQFVPGAPSPEVTGSAGNVRVEARTVTATNGAQISSSTFGTGKGGSVTVIARDSVTFQGTSPQGEELLGVLFPGESTFASGVSVASLGSGAPGTVQVTAPRVTLTEGGGISGLNIVSQGAGGSVVVHASDTLAIAGVGSNISTASLGPGAGGDIALHAGVITLVAGARITAESTGAGNAGRVTLTAPTVAVADGQISAETHGRGIGGNVEIAAARLTLTGSAQVTSSSTGAGQGGRVELATTEALTISGPGRIASSAVSQGAAGTVTVTTATLQIDGPGAIEARTAGAGAGGNIEVRAGTVRLTGGAEISGNTQGEGRGGNVVVTATEPVLLTGPETGLSTRTLGAGVGGDITLQAPRVSLSAGATLSAESTGTGNAGNITVTTQDSFLSTGGSVVTRASLADGGNITISAPLLIRLRDSAITAEVGGGPTTVGGNITIDPQFVLLQNSQIVANAFQGRGGNIRIQAQQAVLADPASLISASSALGIDGQVAIQAPVTSISGSVVPLPQTFARQSDLLRERCAERARAGAVSRLVLGGRDGVPWQPGTWLASPLEPLPLPPSAHRSPTLYERHPEYVAVLSIEDARQGQVSGPYAPKPGPEVGDEECVRWLGVQRRVRLSR